MRAALLAAALGLAAGCYDPNPPSGGYLCAADGACPSGTHCTCGLCVHKDDEAACGFDVNAQQGGASPTVDEHEPFPVTITALQADKTPASGFQGSAQLSFELPDGSRWCDVTPSSVKLTNGSATVMVSLNRETIPPSSPKLTARLAQARGSSGKILVRTPQLQRDATPVAAPATPATPFGWAKNAVITPSFLPKPGGGGFLMYFAGVGDLASGMAIGVATSSDGKTFTPAAAPIVAGKALKPKLYAAPSAMATASGGVTLLFTDTTGFDPSTDTADIVKAVSPDGLSGFVAPQDAMVLSHSSCASYCNRFVAFPSVIADPTPLEAGGQGWLLYFVGLPMGNLPSIGLAPSDDGRVWSAEPAGVIDGSFGGESVLLAPQVFVDGSVYKMYYSFTRRGDFGEPRCTLHLGYATSTDGLYWVRSPSNSSMERPLLAPSTGWDAADVGFLAGGVLVDPSASDPKPASVFYTISRPDPSSLTACTYNGIGRATRP